MARLSKLGSNVISLFSSLGRAQVFLWHIWSAGISFSGVVKQIYFVGVLSLPIILVSGFFVGMVLGLQGYYTLVDFGAADSLGVLVALTLTRELGPVVGAILFAGRSGSALTTEVGLMKATEQLAALELMGIDPMRFVMRPRFIAGIISLPFLVMMFVAVGVLGAWFVSVGLLGIDDGAFWSQMQAKVSWSNDVLNGLVKALIFSVVVTWLALFLGNDAIPTAEGVSGATTATVVYSSLWVLGLDFILTAMMFD
jgi:phospholipid/cholesterol/gamma-HCH transport system permease protein